MLEKNQQAIGNLTHPHDSRQRWGPERILCQAHLLILESLLGRGRRSLGYFLEI